MLNIVRKTIVTWTGLVLGAAGGLAQDKPAQPPPATQPAKAATQPGGTPEKGRPVTAETAKSVLDFTMKDIDGRDVPLAKYRGKVLLIVNVASKCGLTPQYKELEELYKKYAPQGLAIAAFPANNFRAQEPGENAVIKQFCTQTYGVTFDLFGKISVLGGDQAELYKFLTSEKTNPGRAGEIAWNFTKFLVGRDGKVIARFEPKTKPDAPEVIKALETALAAKAP